MSLDRLVKAYRKVAAVPGVLRTPVGRGPATAAIGAAAAPLLTNLGVIYNNYRDATKNNLGPIGHQEQSASNVRHALATGELKPDAGLSDAIQNNKGVQADEIRHAAELGKGKNPPGLPEVREPQITDTTNYNDPALKAKLDAAMAHRGSEPEPWAARNIGVSTGSNTGDLAVGGAAALAGLYGAYRLLRKKQPEE